MTLEGYVCLPEAVRRDVDGFGAPGRAGIPAEADGCREEAGASDVGARALERWFAAAGARGSAADDNWLCTAPQQGSPTPPAAAEAGARAAARVAPDPPELSEVAGAPAEVSDRGASPRPAEAAKGSEQAASLVGVVQIRGRRFAAEVHNHGRTERIGTFSSPELAGLFVDARLRQLGRAPANFAELEPCGRWVERAYCVGAKPSWVHLRVPETWRRQLSAALGRPVADEQQQGRNPSSGYIGVYRMASRWYETRVKNFVTGAFEPVGRFASAHLAAAFADARRRQTCPLDAPMNFGPLVSTGRWIRRSFPSQDPGRPRRCVRLPHNWAEQLERQLGRPVDAREHGVDVDRGVGAGAGAGEVEPKTERKAEPASPESKRKAEDHAPRAARKSRRPSEDGADVAARAGVGVGAALPEARGPRAGEPFRREGAAWVGAGLAADRIVEVAAVLPLSCGGDARAQAASLSGFGGDARALAMSLSCGGDARAQAASLSGFGGGGRAAAAPRSAALDFCPGPMRGAVYVEEAAGRPLGVPHASPLAYGRASTQAVEASLQRAAFDAFLRRGAGAAEAPLRPVVQRPSASPGALSGDFASLRQVPEAAPRRQLGFARVHPTSTRASAWGASLQTLHRPAQLAPTGASAGAPAAAVVGPLRAACPPAPPAAEGDPVLARLQAVLQSDLLRPHLSILLDALRDAR